MSAFEHEREVLISLYEEIIKSIDGAVMSIAGKSGSKRAQGISTCHENLVHVRNLITMLIESVNPEQGMIQSNLWKLYWFSYLKVVEGNLRKDTALMEEVRNVFAELLEGYCGISSRAERGFPMVNMSEQLEEISPSEMMQ